MAKGYMIEKRISAKDVEALNRSAICSTNVDGGTLVSVGAYSNGVWTVTKATSGQGLWMAYNPSEHLTKLDDGKIFAGLSADPRDYTNLANRPMDIFKLQAGVDVVALTDGNIKSTDIASVEVGKFLEQGNEGFEVKSVATASTTSLKVVAIETMPFPNADTTSIGMEFAKVYICEVAQN